MKIRIFLLLVFLFFWPAWATTAHREKVRCPACKAEFGVAVMMSTNNAGGTDRDFLQHAGGSQPILLAMGCCPKCHYANYVDDLLEKPKVPEEIKAFLHSPDFRFPEFEKKRWSGDEEGYSPREVPAWAAYDARAQIVTRTGKAQPKDLANLYLKAAWCVRFEENPFAEECDQLDDASRKLLRPLLPQPTQESNPSDQRIQWATDLLPRVATLPEPQARIAAIWSSYTLREHGENELLLRSWPSLKAHFSSDPTPALQKSVELEKHYQALALDSLTQAIQSEPKANLVYLAGELNRRLGKAQEARQRYDQALTLNPPDWFQEWIKQQKARCTP
jgi:hypothetical protein